MWLKGMRDNKIHCFKADATGKVTIQTEDSTFAGDIIQSLSLYLGLRELSSEVAFPEEEKKLVDALERVKGTVEVSCFIFLRRFQLNKVNPVVDLREIDTRLQAEAASDTTVLKNIIIRLEDARILENVEEMRKRLVQLKNVNMDLIKEHEIRMKSYRDLAANLKELNLGVQRAARLRGKPAILFFVSVNQGTTPFLDFILVGKNASNTVAHCRSAIQDNNPKALLLAIRHE